jgi:chemotaxis protein methyltransferase CheR
MAAMNTLTDREFTDFQRWLYDVAGIHMSAAKKPLICGRLNKRLRDHGLATYGEYFALLQSGRAPGESQVAIDLLTTNETHFFREQKHFDFLRRHVFPEHTRGRAFRAWSAACSSGEEVYTLAMVLHAHFGDGPWEVIGSDLSVRVLERAQRGLYPMERAAEIPPDFLKSYCLRGVGSQDGTLLVERKLRAHTRFLQVNLKSALPALGEFDVIFLRNVMIYFDLEMKRRVVAKLLPLLKPGGWFFISHSESLQGVTEQLRGVAPAVYRKP